MGKAQVIKSRTPTLYIDFQGTLVGEYDSKSDLDSRTAKKVGFELGKALGEKIGLYADAKASLLLKREESAVQADAARLIRDAKQNDWNVVVWTSELPKPVLAVLQRDGVANYVDRIATPHREYVLENGQLQMPKLRFEGENLSKSSIIARAEVKPSIVIGDSLVDLVAVHKAKAEKELVFFKLTRHPEAPAQDFRDVVRYYGIGFNVYEVTSLDKVDRRMFTQLTIRR